MTTLAATALVLFTCAAAATDVRARRIPNAVTGSAAAAALACGALSGGPSAALACAAAMLAAFMVGSLAFSAGWLGGGDVKMIAACCGFAGFPGALSLVLDVLVAGAVLALVTAALRGRLVALVRSTAAVAARGTPAGEVPLPYAVAIAGGSIAFVATALVRP